MAAAMRVCGVENPQVFGMMNADIRYLVPEVAGRTDNYRAYLQVHGRHG